MASVAGRLEGVVQLRQAAICSLYFTGSSLNSAPEVWGLWDQSFQYFL